MPGETAVEQGFFLRTFGTGKEVRTLLIVHGLGDWGGTYEALAERPPLSGMRVLVPDLPGYGLSPRPAAARSLGGLADDLADLLRRRADEPAFVMGHSMGGVIAQLMAERHPALVQAVIDVEGNISKDDCTISGKVAAQSAHEFRRSGFAALLDRMERAAQNDAGAAMYLRTVRMSDPAAFHRHSGELVALSRVEDLARRLAGLPMPACYIAGSPAGAGPRSIALLAQAAVPVTVIRRAGHCPFIDQPDAFLSALARALAGS